MCTGQSPKTRSCQETDTLTNTKSSLVSCGAGFYNWLTHLQWKYSHCGSAGSVLQNVMADSSTQAPNCIWISRIVIPTSLSLFLHAWRCGQRSSTTIHLTSLGEFSREVRDHCQSHVRLSISHERTGRAGQPRDWTIFTYFLLPMHVGLCAALVPMERHTHQCTCSRGLVWNPWRLRRGTPTGNAQRLPNSWMVRLSIRDLRGILGCLKFNAKYIGPFKIIKIIKQIMPMTYRLKLPPHSRIAFSFHVSQLKAVIGCRLAAHRSTRTLKH